MLSTFFQNPKSPRNALSTVFKRSNYFIQVPSGSKVFNPRPISSYLFHQLYSDPEICHPSPVRGWNIYPRFRHLNTLCTGSAEVLNISFKFWNGWSTSPFRIIRTPWIPYALYPKVLKMLSMLSARFQYFAHIIQAS